MASYQNFESPTPEQGQVAAWMFIVAFSVGSFVSLCFALSSSPEHATVRNEFLGVAVGFSVAAFGVWGIKRGIEWFVES